MPSIDQTPPRARGGPQPSFQPGETPCEVATSGRRRKLVAMPLEGEYAPSPLDWSREQADKYAESGGTDAADMKGMPIILLTTVGAKTGKLRKTPLMRVEHDGEYAIVASLGGAPKNPVWYYNVAKNPRVELQDGGVTHDYDAREVFGDEKAAWWERAVAAFPDYAEYQEKTDRQIPVFVLTPVQ
jgi:F420H(2)-dependent quinone reductase